MSTVSRSPHIAKQFSSFGWEQSSPQARLSSPLTSSSRSTKRPGSADRTRRPDSSFRNSRQTTPTSTTKLTATEALDVSRRHRHISLPPIDRIDIFLNQQPDDDGAISPESVISKHYDVELNSGDMVIIVEHCCDCHKHNTTVRHDAIRYLQLGNEILKHLGNVVFTSCLNIRFGVVREPISDISRIGAFEITIVYKAHNGSQVERYELYSKLRTRMWPCVALLEKRLKDFFQSYHVPLYSDPPTYASSAVPVAEFRSPSGFDWERAVARTTCWAIFWLFDGREDEVQALTHSLYLCLSRFVFFLDHRFSFPPLCRIIFPFYSPHTT